MAMKTHEEYSECFKEQMKQKHPQIIVIDEYVNTSTKLRCICNICKYEWMSSPNNLISMGRGCPKCGHSLKKTHDEFCEELKQIRPDLILLNKYESNKKKVKLNA